MGVAVFHRVGEPNRETFTNSLEQILAYDGQVTFDGVYESVFDHRLELTRTKPILFITGSQIGREGYCNKEQLLELKRLGFTLAWHGWSHNRLTELADNQVIMELRQPDWIRSIYAYPHGDFDERITGLVNKMNFQEAYSTTQGNDERYSLHREYL